MGLCFTTSEGRPLDPKTVNTNLKAFVAKAKIAKKISFHKLRYTVGPHLVARGVPLNVVKEILGHSLIANTANLYAHAVPAAHRAAFDVLEQAYQTKGQ
ncbi:MAG: site-specific integrase [Fimbriimonadaceae bacterium]|nr:site-specific integrase [Fimbriimonadaceae bacterium]